MKIDQETINAIVGEQHQDKPFEDLPKRVQGHVKDVVEGHPYRLESKVEQYEANKALQEQEEG